jgi:hypothetical protein
MNVGIGTVGGRIVPFVGKKCFEFSVLCLCSAEIDYR